MTEKAKNVGLVISPDPKNRSVDVGVDTDGDKEPDMKFKIPIKDPRLWAIITAIFVIIGGTKYIGLW